MTTGPSTPVELSHDLDALASAVSAHPQDVEARVHLFWALTQAARYDESLEQAKAIVHLAPNAPEGYLFMGNMLVMLERHLEASEVYERGLDLNPAAVELARGAGNACLKRTDYEGALRAFHHAVRLAPREPLSHVDLGRLRHKQTRYADAIRHLERALAIDPDDVIALTHVGVVWRSLRQWDEAIKAFERAYELEPENPKVLAHLGTFAMLNGEIARACELFVLANELVPGQAELLSLLGGAELNAGQWGLAGEHLAAGVAADPTRLDVRFNYSLYLLTMGELAQGWDAFEAGLDLEQRAVIWQFPRWGQQNVEGKSLYIAAEQGLGDEIMFASCLPDLVRDVGPQGRIVAGLDRRLTGMLSRAFPEVEFIVDPKLAGTAQVRQLEGIDGQLAIGSLAPRYRRAESDFPAIRRFLAPLPDVSQFVADRLATFGDGIKVGISWRGGGLPLTQAHRSIELADWAPLLGRDDVIPFNLQYGDSRDELAALHIETDVTVHDINVDLKNDLEGLSALLANLDLVISVDNTTVHLAGALGVETWVIVPAKPDWRWMLERQDSPWYPSLRLFRRGADEAPAGVFERLGQALDARPS